jgi:biopolymer transport protein ExbD
MNMMPLAVAPLASVLAILATVAAVRPVSHGVPVHFGSLQRCPPAVLSDPIVVAHVTSEADLFLREQRIRMRDLDASLREIYLNRAERWLLVHADGGVPMQGVLRVMDAAFKYEVNMVWLPRLEPSTFNCLAISTTRLDWVNPWHRPPGPPPAIRLNEVPWWPYWPN